MQKEQKNNGNRRSFYCEHDLYRKLESIANKEHRSVSNLIRMILKRHLGARDAAVKRRRGK